MPDDHFDLPLMDKRTVNGKYLVFTLGYEGSGYSFRAGKYATLSISSEKGGKPDLTRIFSIACSPNGNGELRFATILREQSEFKSRLAGMEKGESVDVSPPSGGFFLISDRSRPVVFITSEVGVTPVVSMAKWSAEEETGQRMHLLYINRSREDELFSDEFEALAAASPSFTFSRRNGQEVIDQGAAAILKEDLESSAPDLDAGKAAFYVSGKPGFVFSARKSMKESEWSGQTMKVESFSGY